MSEQLNPADVFFTRGHGLVSRLIRFFTRDAGERRTKVNHVGIVVVAGALETAEVIEALSRVRQHRLWFQHGPPKQDEVAIYRPTDLLPEEAATVVGAARGYLNRRYGWFKVVAHLLDWFLQGAHVFRRLASMDKYPICSWLVAHAFKKVGRHFGVAPGMADPDHIWDYVTAHPEKYTLVRALGRLEAKGRGDPR